MQRLSLKRSLTAYLVRLNWTLKRGLVQRLGLMKALTA